MGNLNTSPEGSDQDHSGGVMEEKELTPLEKIGKIFDTFTQEELGNRLSQFAMLTLRTMVINEVKAMIEKDNG